MNLEDIRHRVNIVVTELFMGPFLGTCEVADDGAREVYCFSSPVNVGMALPWGDILLNEMLFQEDWEDVLEYVYLHERGHHADHPLMLLVGGAAQLLLYPAHLVLWTVLFLGALLMKLSGFTFGMPQSDVVLLLAGIPVIVAVAVSLSLAAEIRADLYALDRLAPDRFHAARSRLAKQFLQDSLLYELFMRISHPTPGLVLRVDAWR